MRSRESPQRGVAPRRGPTHRRIEMPRRTSRSGCGRRGPCAGSAARRRAAESRRRRGPEGVPTAWPILGSGRVPARVLAGKALNGRSILGPATVSVAGAGPGPSPGKSMAGWSGLVVIHAVPGCRVLALGPATPGDRPSVRGTLRLLLSVFSNGVALGPATLGDDRPSVRGTLRLLLPSRTAAASGPLARIRKVGSAYIVRVSILCTSCVLFDIFCMLYL